MTDKSPAITTIANKQNGNIRASGIKLLKVVPVEAFTNYAHRRKVVQWVVTMLNAVIWTYNKLFRLKQTILTGCSIAVFLFVYSILPVFIALLGCFVPTALLSGLSISELYQHTMDNPTIFVALGMSFTAVYLAEIMMVLWGQGQSGLTNLEIYLMSIIHRIFSKFISVSKEVIIGAYRETGWSVLEVMAREQHEGKQAVRTILNEQGLPDELIGLIQDFAVDDKLDVLLHSRHLLDEPADEKNHEQRELQQRASNLRPFQIFQMYALGEGV